MIYEAKMSNEDEDCSEACHTILVDMIRGIIL